ncbi:MAG: DUF4410 domain-containing protein [Halioglobus sp.]|nr:DUF4410 domain-containing protein [Halioglobus pacificus]NQX90451.1 DUF4410 domain-containing protein [Halioglobus sp.]
MDSQNIFSGALSKSAPIHIHPFSTSEADLGNPKFRDTANAMVKSAPHLLAADIVESLRDAGFTSVTLDESEGDIPIDALNVTGRFTRLDPGRQNLRVWIGFGTGESKVCVSGEVADPDGNKLADSADCRNGLGWGSSGPQADKGAEVLGERVAGFLIDWADS